MADLFKIRKQASEMRAEAISKGTSQMLDKIRKKLEQRRNTNNTIKLLNSFTDAELRDIGITRGQIEPAVRGMLDVHRTARDED